MNLKKKLNKSIESILMTKIMTIMKNQIMHKTLGTQ